MKFVQLHAFVTLEAQSELLRASQHVISLQAPLAGREEYHLIRYDIFFGGAYACSLQS